MNKCLHEYMDRSKVGRLDYFRQLTFLTFTPLSTILFSLHLLGSYGLPTHPALACSACYISATMAAVCLYLWKGPKILKRILPVYLIACTLIQCVRLLILADMGLVDPMLTTINVAVCYIIVFVGCMTMFLRTISACTVINIFTLVTCHIVTHELMYGQLLIVFGMMMIATTAFCFVSRKLLNEEHVELLDYASTVGQILHLLNMSKTELLAILQLLEANDAQSIYDEELIGRLSPRTMRNFLHLATQIERKKANGRKNLLERFPTLSPAELDVCRLVEQGLTLKQIAEALGKSTSNVSTVRGNIRKKLGLSQDEDLKSYLLNKAKI